MVTLKLLIPLSGVGKRDLDARVDIILALGKVTITRIAAIDL